MASTRIGTGCCRSSVVEHSLGKDVDPREHPSKFSIFGPFIPGTVRERTENCVFAL